MRRTPLAFAITVAVLSALALICTTAGCDSGDYNSADSELEKQCNEVAHSWCSADDIKRGVSCVELPVFFRCYYGTDGDCRTWYKCSVAPTWAPTEQVP